ncbi:MAG: class I mannose-6-phosphate isomerase [Candidatus Hydrogenedentes bacterium]|nr:class I mannose-6-phosphate isomerase [Candidatus Hydrogenedentota bacterium]
MDLNALGPLRFQEQYFDRIWGGRRLASAYGKPLPPDVPIGEAWLVSDHPSAESIVAGGPCAGLTLHQLLEQDSAAILGSRATLTVHGRFPLLLKLLDSSDWLSVQVHPDDECAARLGEPDVGKTEMWHILHAEPDSELICGLDPSVNRAGLLGAAEAGTLGALLPRFTVEPGDSVFVRAGTVHAIGDGIVLAEIQQNSDLTYRLYDWDRVDASGKPRALHLDKSAESIHFGSCHGGKSTPLIVPGDSPAGGKREILAACRHFAAERIACPAQWRRETRSESFHLLLCIRGELTVSSGARDTHLAPGQACLVPGHFPAFEVDGPADFLDYHVPDLEIDIFSPLSGVYSQEEIARVADSH